jgi:hypothetical protein
VPGGGRSSARVVGGVHGLSQPPDRSCSFRKATHAGLTACRPGEELLDGSGGCTAPSMCISETWGERSNRIRHTRLHLQAGFFPPKPSHGHAPAASALQPLRSVSRLAAAEVQPGACVARDWVPHLELPRIRSRRRKNWYGVATRRVLGGRTMALHEVISCAVAAYRG